MNASASVGVHLIADFPTKTGIVMDLSHGETRAAGLRRRLLRQRLQGDWVAAIVGVADEMSVSADVQGGIGYGIHHHLEVGMGNQVGKLKSVVVPGERI